MKMFGNLIIISTLLVIGCNGISKNDGKKQSKADLGKTEKIKEEVNTESLIYKPFKLYNNDTLQYLKQNFVDHKEYYLNKPLKVLLSQLEIEIDNITPGDTGYYRPIRYTVSIALNFRKKRAEEGVDYYRKKSGVLIVSLKDEIPEDTLVAANGSYNFKWSDRLKHFLEDKKIRDIKTIKSFYK